MTLLSMSCRLGWYPMPKTMVMLADSGIGIMQRAWVLVVLQIAFKDD